MSFLAVWPAFAQETITYTYDNKGRLKVVNHGTTGPNPNVVASYTYDGADNRCNVTVTTNGTTGTGPCTITSAPTLSPTSLPTGYVGSGYSQTITATGGTGSGYSFSVSSGALPTGLALSSSGLLSGTPSATGTYGFTIKAVDSASYAGSQSYSVPIGAGGPCAGVSFSVNNSEVSEGSPLVFTVTKSGATSNSCSVSYATANGTAVAGTNYLAASGTLTFSSTQTTLTVSVTTYGDQILSGRTKTLYLNLSNPTGAATLTNTQGVGTLDGTICTTC